MERTGKSEEQKAAEREVDAFRRSLGPFVVAAESTQMPMVFADAKTPDHSIVFANESFLRLTGFKREELLGRAFASLLADAQALGDWGSFEGTDQDAGSEPELRFGRKDGCAFWATEDLGCSSVTNAASVDEAIARVREPSFDAAMLDANLDGNASDPIADPLVACSIPFFFATGYSSCAREGRHLGRHVLRKPFRLDDLATSFRKILPVAA